MKRLLIIKSCLGCPYLVRFCRVKDRFIKSDENLPIAFLCSETLKCSTEYVYGGLGHDFSDLMKDCPLPKIEEDENGQTDK